MKKIAALAVATTMIITTCIPVFAAPGNAQTTNTPTATARAAQTPAATVTAEQAKAIALKNAGLTEQEVRFVKNQLEYDDGILQYDIEFVKGQTEYEYDIDAATGAIISVDIDIVHSII